MKIDFDPDKNAKNILERGLSFERVAEFDFETALFTIDNRRDYGETRYRALGFIDQRLHALVFAETIGGIREISFSLANKREVKHYEGQSRID
ncbi:MAG: BrnT family toxin [Methylobacter sp.]|nr:BrnT family toxin [Methylobacter sp.]